MKQGIFELSSTKEYPIAKRYAIDERVFRYAQIGGVASVIGRAVANLSEATENALAAATSAIGAVTVTITVQASAGLAENELQGGHLCYAWFYRHRIKSHPAAANGATCVLTLETPIYGTAVTINSTRLIAYHNPWKKVGYGGAYGALVSFVGMPFDAIAIGQYTWVQTWGPCTGAPAAFFGTVASERQVRFAGDGSLTCFATGNAQGGYQHAGFWLPNTRLGSVAGVGGTPTAMADGGHLFELQIAP